MTDPYLVAHKVRGQPAFDIAERMPCPICDASNGMPREEYCHGCNNEGYWWIVSTSGHRAHPYRYWLMEDIYDGSDYDAPKPLSMLDTMPLDCPDHYPVNPSPAPKRDGASLLSALGLLPKAPTVVIKRRV